MIGISSSNRSGTENAADDSWLHRVFAIDLRSLAAWRMALAVLVLLDVRLRWPVAESMYSDAGWLTRELAGTLHRQLAGEVPAHAIWSVLWLDGSATFGRLVLAGTALAAIPFLIGWKTRFFNLVLWILVASIHARNPLVTTSADMLLKLMLMWGMFLPLGRVWSVDARRRACPGTAKRGGQIPNRSEDCAVWRQTPAVPGQARKNGPPDNGPVLSLASVGLILQLVQLYVFSGMAKLNGAWLDGTAMEYVLRLDLYTTTFGQRLLDFPRLVSGIAWGTLVLELGAVWLVLIPCRSAWPRIVTLLLFWSFHAGIGLTMQIGLFCPICMSIWLVTIPAGFWDRVTGRRAESMVPNRVSDSRMPALVSLLCVLLIVWTLAWNIGQAAGSRFPGFLRTPIALLGRVLAVDQNFQMFGQLHQENSWFVFRATLADGSEADLLRGVAPPVWEKPPRVAASIPDHNWRKLLDNLTQERFAAYRQPLLESVVRDWNRRHEPGRQVVATELVKLSQPIGPGFNGIDQKSAVWATAGKAVDRPGSRFDEMLRRMKEGTGPAF